MFKRTISGYRLLFLTLIFVAVNVKAEKPQITIRGADSVLQENLYNMLSLVSESCESPAWRIKKRFERSPAQMDQAARALGYYQLKVEKELTFEEGCWQAHYVIEPGEPVLLESVDVYLLGDAKQDIEFSRVVRQSKVQVGEQLHHGEYTRLKGKIEALAAERGYFDGLFSQASLQVDTHRRRAAVTLRYDSGRRYRIGRLDVQQSSYAPGLLERYIKIAEGDDYAATSLVQLHQSLSNSGYFDKVDVVPDFAGATDGIIDVEVRLEPRKSTAYSIGVGAATDIGPRVRASYEKRRINRHGHRLKSELQLSGAENSVGLEYIVPTQMANIEQINFRASYQQNETESSQSDITNTGIRTIGSRGDWVESLSLDWVSEDSLISDEAVQAELLVSGVSWSNTVADNRLRPTQGYRASLEVKGAAQALLSDVSFIQISASTKWIAPFGAGRLILRGDAAHSVSDRFDDLPASYRLFAGGDQSLRGYAYDSLGPADPSGDVIGGETLLTGSVEYEHPVVDDWSAALFWDGGDAFSEWDFNLKQAVGIGARWSSPIGPIRLDLAIPSDNDQDAYRIHFSMGADL